MNPNPFIGGYHGISRWLTDNGYLDNQTNECEYVRIRQHAREIGPNVKYEVRGAGNEQVSVMIFHGNKPVDYVTLTR